MVSESYHGLKKGIGFRKLWKEDSKIIEKQGLKFRKYKNDVKL